MQCLSVLATRYSSSITGLPVLVVTASSAHEQGETPNSLKLRCLVVVAKPNRLNGVDSIDFLSSKSNLQLSNTAITSLTDIALTYSDSLESFGGSFLRIWDTGDSLLSSTFKTRFVPYGRLGFLVWLQCHSNFSVPVKSTLQAFCPCDSANKSAFCARSSRKTRWGYGHH